MRKQHIVPILVSNVIITENVNEALEFINTPNYKILSMSELGDIPLDHPNVVGGQCLLPPMDALIAAEDNKPQLFDQIYSAHFHEDFQVTFVSALLAYLYNGGNLMIYFPGLMSQEDVSGKKFVEHAWLELGILPGNRYTQVNYNTNFVGLWLDLLYMHDLITPQEYMFYYPDIPMNIMFINKLMIDLRPYGITMDESSRINYIEYLRDKISENSKVISPIYQI